MSYFAIDANIMKKSGPTLSLLVVAFTIPLVCASSYHPFNEYSEIGLKNDKGEVCLGVSFGVYLINFNINATDNLIPFDLLSESTAIGGNCASSSRSEALLTATIKDGNRQRKLEFYFRTRNVYVKNVEELRWQLSKVLYVESYDDQLAVFSSDNSSIIISAPLNQKYVCKDKVNITLRADGFKNVVVAFTPDIDIQPYGPKSNFYLCERTRKRTLTESFDNKATVFSGVVLGLSSVGAIIGHSIRRHFMPVRKEMYENLGS